MSKIACIGTGTVGAAWAVVFARAGHEVALYDALPDEVAERTLPRAAKALGLLEAFAPSDESIETILQRLRPAVSIAEAVAGAAYVQESVREDLSVKQGVFSEIAAAAPIAAILASSTSAIPGSNFLGHIPAPERALVVHPVNPPAYIPLVELCGTQWTSPETMAAARAFMSEIGMRPIIVKKEIEGFILNRLQFTLVAEAMHLVGEGYVSAEDLDAVLTDGLALRWASIGPFEVAHLNAPDGLQGFVDRLGPMMKRMGAAARTDYDWTPEQVAQLHAALSVRVPVDEIADRQAWRDQRILATRRLKRDHP
jgi:L-gulonate 3-dehydrogenase